MTNRIRFSLWIGNLYEFLQAFCRLVMRQEIFALSLTRENLHTFWSDFCDNLICNRGFHHCLYNLRTLFMCSWKLAMQRACLCKGQSLVEVRSILKLLFLLRPLNNFRSLSLHWDRWMNLHEMFQLFSAQLFISFIQAFSLINFNLLGQFLFRSNENLQSLQIFP